jgi:hypothetical protein
MSLWHYISYFLAPDDNSLFQLVYSWYHYTSPLGARWYYAKSSLCQGGDKILVLLLFFLLAYLRIYIISLKHVTINFLHVVHLFYSIHTGLMGNCEFRETSLIINLVNKIWDIWHKNIPLNSYLKSVSNNIIFVIYILYFIDQISSQTCFLKCVFTH